jgi:hypothetical protein
MKVVKNEKYVKTMNRYTNIFVVSSLGIFCIAIALMFYFQSISVEVYEATNSFRIFINEDLLVHGLVLQSLGVTLIMILDIIYNH